MQDLPIDRLGPYPILQFAAALLVMGGLAIAVWRGIQDRKKNGNFPGEQRYFFDGPVIQALEMLKEMRDQNHRLIELKEEHINLVRDANETLRDIKSKFDLMIQFKKF